MKKLIPVLALSIILFKSNLVLASLLPPGGDWFSEAYYVSSTSINVYETASQNSKITGHYYFNERLITIVDPSFPSPPGWRKSIYPQKGYIEDKNIITLNEKLKTNDSGWYSTWQYEIRYCRKNNAFIKEAPYDKSGNSALIKNGEKVIIVFENNNSNKVWAKTIYPVNGFVQCDDFDTRTPGIIAGIGGLYGAVNIPYEKNLSNLKRPFGGFVEISRFNWLLIFRIGFNHAESNISQYVLKTNLVYAIARYDLISIFNNHLKPYVFAGGSYWYSSFQNTKYPSLLSTYFPLDKDNGPGYIGGGGLIYSLFSFFIDVQYFYSGSGKAVFGKEPLAGEFTNQNILYPGANQLNVMFGYRIEL